MNVDAFMQPGERVRHHQRGARRRLQDAQHAGAHPSDAHRARRPSCSSGSRSGDYDRILRGEYIRRGAESARSGRSRTTSPPRGDHYAGEARESATQVADAAQAGRRTGAARRSARPRSREDAGRRRRRAGSTHSAGRSAAKTPPPTLYCAPGNPGTAELAAEPPHPRRRPRPHRRRGRHARHRPHRRRARGAARARPRRPAARRGTRCRSGRAPRPRSRGLEGVRQGGHGGGRHPHRGEPHLHRSRGGARVRRRHPSRWW